MKAFRLGCFLGIHKWDKGRCAGVRSCLYCDKVKNISPYLHYPHKWQEPVYEEGSCDLIHICSKCGEKDIVTKEKHVWSDWQSKASHPCIQERSCQRCGKIDISYSHNWGEWEEDELSCIRTRVCSLCKEKQTEVYHIWGEWRWENKNEHVRYCTRNPDHKEKESHNFITTTETRIETDPGGGKCIDPSWGLCNDRDTIITEVITKCEKCGYRDVREINRRVEESGRL